MHANVSIHEPEQPHDPDTALAFSMEGYPGHPPPPLIPRFWAPGWNSIQALNKFQDEVGGPLSGGDPGERLIEPARGKKLLILKIYRLVSSRTRANGCCCRCTTSLVRRS